VDLRETAALKYDCRHNPAVGMMAQNVDSGPDAGSPRCIADKIPSTLTSERRSVVLAQYALAAEMPRLAHHFGQPLGHPNESNAPVLRRRQLATPVRMPHAQLPSFEVNICPLERDDLART
jgi:hypothetical protein